MCATVVPCATAVQQRTLVWPTGNSCTHTGFFCTQTFSAKEPVRLTASDALQCTHRSCMCADRNPACAFRSPACACRGFLCADRKPRCADRSFVYRNEALGSQGAWLSIRRVCASYTACSTFGAGISCTLRDRSLPEFYVRPDFRALQAIMLIEKHRRMSCPQASKRLTPSMRRVKNVHATPVNQTDEVPT